jgi:hypothetical protein
VYIVIDDDILSGHRHPIFSTSVFDTPLNILDYLANKQVCKRYTKRSCAGLSDHEYLDLNWQLANFQPLFVSIKHRLMMELLLLFALKTNKSEN